MSVTCFIIIGLVGISHWKTYENHRLPCTFVYKHSDFYFICPTCAKVSYAIVVTLPSNFGVKTMSDVENSMSDIERTKSDLEIFKSDIDRSQQTTHAADAGSRRIRKSLFPHPGRM